LNSKAVRVISAGIVLLIAIIYLILRLSGREQTPGTESFFGMDTIMTITAYGENADTAIERAKIRVNELEKKLSVTIPDSEVSLINSAQGSAISVSDDLVYITKEAIDYSLLTKGSFDITLYPVSKLWGFTGGEHRIPTDKEIQSALALTGFSMIELKETANEISVPKGAMLDYGAIAKGYAGDEIVKILKEEGIESAIINLGGSISLIGSKSGNKPWKIAVKDPSGNGSVGTLSLKDCSVVTSGKHERFFVDEDGKEYCHIIDPTTGRPVETDMDSLTVVCDSALKGDALSTALYVMGWERAVDFYRNNSGIELIGVFGDTVYITQGLQDSFSPSKEYKVDFVSK